LKKVAVQSESDEHCQALLSLAFESPDSTMATYTCAGKELVQTNIAPSAFQNHH
jgi:hypothetical protein